MSNPQGRPKKRDLVVSPEQNITLQQPRSSQSLALHAQETLNPDSATESDLTAGGVSE
jgi:hypothetical protein